MRTFATFQLCLFSCVSHFYYTTQYHSSSSWKEQNADHKNDLFPGKITRPILNISLVLQPAWEIFHVYLQRDRAQFFASCAALMVLVRRTSPVSGKDTQPFVIIN